jgi:hypothetical protein
MARQTNVAEADSKRTRRANQRYRWRSPTAQPRASLRRLRPSIEAPVLCRTRAAAALAPGTARRGCSFGSRAAQFFSGWGVWLATESPGRNSPVLPGLVWAKLSHKLTRSASSRCLRLRFSGESGSASLRSSVAFTAASRALRSASEGRPNASPYMPFAAYHAMLPNVRSRPIVNRSVLAPSIRVQPTATPNKAMSSANFTNFIGPVLLAGAKNAMASGLHPVQVWTISASPRLRGHKAQPHPHRFGRRRGQLCTFVNPPAVHLQAGNAVQTSGATSVCRRRNLKKPSDAQRSADRRRQPAGVTPEHFLNALLKAASDS